MAAMWRFFSNFKNGPARSQTSPNNSLIIASAGLPPAPFEVTDWPVTTRSGVARQPNYSPWQVDLCATVGAVRTDVVHTGGLPAMHVLFLLFLRLFVWSDMNNYYALGFCLTSLFFHKLLQLGLVPKGELLQFDEAWFFLHMDAIPITKQTIPKH